MIADIVRLGNRVKVVERWDPPIGAELKRYVTYSGNHPFEDGHQMIMKFPNGRGASIAETTTTDGLQMHPTRLVDGEWILDGELHADLDAEYLVQLLMEIKEQP